MKRFAWGDMSGWFLRVHNPVMPSSRHHWLWEKHPYFYMLVLVATGSTNTNFSAFGMIGRAQGFVNVFNKSTVTNLLMWWCKLQKWGFFKREGQASGNGNEEQELHTLGESQISFRAGMWGKMFRKKDEHAENFGDGRLQVSRNVDRIV